MNFFSIRTNDQHTISEVLGAQKFVIFDNLSWHKNEIQKKDIIFIVVSGDKGKKTISYENGLRAIGHVISLPIDDQDRKHFSIKVQILDVLPRSITKEDFYIFPLLIDAPNIGPDTKTAPNQAFRKVEPKTGEAIIKAMMEILKEKFDHSKYSSIVNTTEKLEKLEIKNNSSTTPFSLLRVKFIEWFNSPNNNVKSYNGLVTEKVLDFWDTSFFYNRLFVLDKTDLQQSLSSIEKLISDRDNIEWKQYSYATNRGAPEAVLGRKNYLKFLSEFISAEENLVLLSDSEIEENEGVKAGLSFSTDAFYLKAKEANMHFDKWTIARFVSSLLTKPFVILTGLSGSGKTKLAQSFASWICADESQYCIVPVGADWTNSERLLGFPNALNRDEYILPQNGTLDLIIRADDNLNKPYFLILDEMNLSHVERYFSDFLSAMESKSYIDLHSENKFIGKVPSKIKLPKNLFIVGTVNIDETTYMFSPKVLDRANVIEFRVTRKDMATFLQSNEEINMEILIGKGESMAGGFLALSTHIDIPASDKEIIVSSLLSFFEELKNVGSEFGYRSASEVVKFIGIARKLDITWDIEQILDVAIMQKLLPKIHGSRKKLTPVLERLGNLCLLEGNSVTNIFDLSSKVDYVTVAKYPISLEKITRMYRNLIENGFTSYAEA
jgi:5-methylcytosine-specific restriction protein B